MGFIPDELVDAVFGREARSCLCLVLSHALAKVVRRPGIERAVSFARKNVDEKELHCFPVVEDFKIAFRPPRRKSGSSLGNMSGSARLVLFIWIPAFAGKNGVGEAGRAGETRRLRMRRVRTTRRIASALRLLSIALRFGRLNIIFKHSYFKDRSQLGESGMEIPFDWKDVIPTLLSSLLGFLVAFYFYRRQIKRKQIRYSTITNRLFGEEIKSVTGMGFKWGDIEINNPYFIRVIVWNVGNETIAYDELSKLDKLRFVMPEFKMLGARYYDTSSAVCRPLFKITDKRDTLEVAFEFLEPRNGFAIDIVGDFKTEKKEKPTGFFMGAIKGSKVSSWPVFSISGGVQQRVIFLIIVLCAILSAIGVVPLISKFATIPLTVDISISAFLALITVVNTGIWALLAFVTLPRSDYPTMLLNNKDMLKEIGENGAIGKWQVIFQSFQAFQQTRKQTDRNA